MTQWAAEVLLALRAAGWPEPKAYPAYPSYLGRNVVIRIRDRDARVIGMADCLSITGPPRNVAQTLNYWREIAE